MTFAEIEQLAKEQEPLPTRPKPEEWLCWKCMADLYRRYRARQIDRGAARLEKQEIRRKYLDAAFSRARQEAVWAQHQEAVRLGGKYLYQIREAVKGRAEPLAVAALALKLYGALCGETLSADTLIEQMGGVSCEKPCPDR